MGTTATDPSGGPVKRQSCLVAGLLKKTSWSSNIRLVASGFANDVSHTLLELFEGLEAEALRLEGQMASEVVQAAPPARA